MNFPEILCRVCFEIVFEHFRSGEPNMRTLVEVNEP